MADGVLKPLRDIIFIVIIVGSIIYSFVNVNTLQECDDFHKLCDEYEYCGVDNTCHQFPVKEKAIIDRQHTLTIQRFVLPSYLLGLAIIIGTFVGKKKNVW